MSGQRSALDTVRKLRKDAERERAGHLAEARGWADQAQAAVENVDAMDKAGRAAMHRLASEPGTVQAIRVVLEQLGLHREEADRRASEAATVVRDRYDEFVEALQERRTIDRLRDRRQEAERLASQRKETKAMDEVTSNRHVRRANTPGADGGTE